MRKLLDRILGHPVYRAIAHISTIKFALAGIVAVVEVVESEMHGKPLEIVLLYSSVAAAATLVALDYCVKGYERIRKGKPLSSTETKPKPNLVLSRWHGDVLTQSSVFERDDVIGGLVVEFYNDVSNPLDRALGVVAHLSYFKEPRSRKVPGNSIWNTTRGLWEPGHLESKSFEMNTTGKLVIAVIVEGEATYGREKPLTVHAIGCNDASAANPFGLDAFPIDGILPVVVYVTLRGHDLRKGFIFRILKHKDGSYYCEPVF